MANKNLWNYTVAENILKQFGKDEEIVFESGFGPSGYPHIGTYGEIGRPKYVIKALKDISDKKTKYIVFSDDLDGLRKVPLGMPEMLREHLGKPVSKIPDPWGCCESFSQHMINQILGFLKEQNLNYDVFKYSHEAYESGEFNKALTTLLQNHEKVESIILPTMREESRKGWSPFMPICEKCGRNLSTRVTGYQKETNSLRYVCDKDSENFKSCGHQGEVSVLNGKVKVGWKIDWALRWYTYKVNFEMYGKDLMEAATLSGKIVRTVLGGRPPMGYFYEMFLDEEGAKISKSIGKGLTVESWIKMAPQESLNLFLFKAPQKAKKLEIKTIPRYVDEYLASMNEYYNKAPDARREEGKYSDTFEFVTGDIPKENPYQYRTSYNLLANLIAAVGKSDVDLIKNYVLKYEKEIPSSNAFLEDLIAKATHYVENVMSEDRTSPTLADNERETVHKFVDYLNSGSHSEEEIQTQVFELAKAANIEPQRFFQIIYGLLSGQTSGPRLGSFIHLMGDKEVADRLRVGLENNG